MNEEEPMPYKVQGNKVLHEKNGKWSVKQTCKSPAAAKAAVRLLYAVEKGSLKHVKGKKRLVRRTSSNNSNKFREHSWR